MDTENRVIVLIDMDCFYCQVEEKLNPELEGKPIAVVQYNPWKGGGIIAVNYVARAMGVTRHMRGDEAKEKCPEIQLPSVPCLRGKADITKYRDAGKEVAKVLQKFTNLLERASIDEAYLDITESVKNRLRTQSVNTIESNMIPNTFALGYESIEEFIQDIQNGGSCSIDFDYENAGHLLVGALIVSEIRAAVYEETGYRCSAGIAHNKILAKLVCGMNKPNKQTVLPKHSINILYKSLPLKKVKHLGGKFGETVCKMLNINNMGELQNFPEKVLQSKFDDKNGTWLYNIARGIDLEPVQARFNPKRIGCCKQFKGKAALLDLDSLRKWLNDLGEEIEDRLEKDGLENNRTPKQMVVSFSAELPDGKDTSSSRSYNFMLTDELHGQFFSSKALELLMESAEGVKIKEDEPNRRLKGPIKFLGISVGKFEDNLENKKIKKINDYFTAGMSADMTKIKSEFSENMANEKKNSKKNEEKEFVLKKYFQTKESTESNENQAVTNIEDDNLVHKIEKESHVSSSLFKQESFFAKFLNTKKSTVTQAVNEEKELIDRTTTTVCNVVECRDNSNDSNYSSSTIDMEINKSIALFEEEPDDTERVSSIRELLNNSAVNLPILEEQNVEGNQDPPHNVEMFECPECNKPVSIDMVEIHSDYHLALKLREEEREFVRKEKRLKHIPSNEPVRKSITQKNDKTIASFLIKIDDNVPTQLCPECGKKVPIDNFSEHLDFHEAQRLSKELNKKSNTNVVVVKNNSSVKRKRKTTSPVNKTKVPCKSIASFFR